MPKMRTDDGIEIHYHVDDYRDPWATGPDETILLSHGFSRSMKWWIQWVPALSRKYRVLRYDIRGCGQSSIPPEGATWSGERLAKDVLNLIDHLSIQKVHWVSFESGGLWGIVFATSYPDRIKSLSMMTTPYAKGGRLGESSSIVREKGLRGWLMDTNRDRLDHSVASPELVEWHLAEHSKTPTPVAVSIMQVVEQTDLTKLLPKIQVPTLMMVGGNSPNRPMEMMRAMETDIPNTKLVVFPGIGNGIQLLMPDQCIAEVLKHVE